MGKRSERPDDPELLRQKLIGLGERSLRKSYYPQLQSRMKELERFRALLDYSEDAIFLINASDMTVVDANRSSGAMLHGSATNIKGRHFLDLIEVGQDSPLGALLTNETGHEANLAQGICRFKSAGKAGLPVEFTARKVQFAEESYIVFVGRDIRDRLRAESEKEEIQKQLIQAQKMEAVGILSGGIAHDFNNILSVIMGFAEIACDSALSGQADLSSLREIIGSAERAKLLVQQIMAFSRKNEPALKVLSLNKVVGGTVSLLARTLPKMINIQSNLADALPPIQADPTQLEQVLLNLSSNAADAMPHGGTLSIRTTLADLDQTYCGRHPEVSPGKYAALTISDTGQGISEEVREHIFDPFFTTKDLGKGTGLGLSTVYGIIKNHGGQIQCQSELGRGTSFRILFPVFQGTADESSGEIAIGVASATQGKETILLVDDEEGLLHLGTLTLKGAGYQVITASNGEEALKAYQSGARHPDLVVMDLGMPGMGGHKAMKAIRAINPEAKIVIASGYLPESQPQDAMDDGAAAFVAKPFTRAELLSAIRKALDED